MLHNGTSCSLAQDIVESVRHELRSLFGANRSPEKRLLRRRAGMNVPEGIGQALFQALSAIAGKMREIVVDGARYDVKIQPLDGARHRL